MTTRLTFWRVSLPLVSRFASSRSSVISRDLCLVALRRADHVGWGEAAPYPSHTRDTIDDVCAWLESHGRDAVTDPSLSGPMTGRAALDQASSDLAAKEEGRPLWQWLGGVRDRISAGAVVSLGEDVVDEVGGLVDAGYRFLKMKIDAAASPEKVQQVVEGHPDIDFGADANGAFVDPADEILTAIDELGLVFIEEPLRGRGPLTEFTRATKTRIASDETAASYSDASAIPDGLADIITLKTGRRGTAGARSAAKTLTARGFRLRVGGLIESGIGRAHSLALASLGEVGVPGDLAAADRYFEHDIVDPPWHLTDGDLVLPHSPGIGVQVNEDALDSQAEARVEL